MAILLSPVRRFFRRRRQKVTKEFYEAFMDWVMPMLEANNRRARLQAIIDERRGAEEQQ